MVNHLSSSCSPLWTFFSCTIYLHGLLHYIRGPLCSPSWPPACHFPPPPQRVHRSSSSLISKTSNLHRPFEVLISCPVLLGHSLREVQHFDIFCLQLCFLSHLVVLSCFQHSSEKKKKVSLSCQRNETFSLFVCFFFQRDCVIKLWYYKRRRYLCLMGCFFLKSSLCS